MALQDQSWPTSFEKSKGGGALSKQWVDDVSVVPGISTSGGPKMYPSFFHLSLL